ncbi:MAG TPA: ABC transporter ATP-binding protein [Thermoanaerobaculales bacterium]|nr:ABC transporter ATP-binding protein [Thermoanaerobaculales bacterium]HPA80828.1 ABC transporter ATP-binding protein [Thermoanaerobaculales bacterium]HQL28697.1 ABC transporter ATP-binding protein [Thermoanaerobaculales bacterium]
MSAPAIRSELLSKRYRLGERRPFKSLRESLSGAFRRPLAGRRHREHIWALDAVSFEIAEGEAVGVIGRNGAGKSTLLKVLSRITQPTSGRAEVRGRIGSLLEVGTGFHPELTGRENISLNGAILGMKRAEIAAKFDEIVDFAGVERFIDTPVKRFSSGMYLRLAFAVAAHLEPEILLVDEVLAVGDLAFQKKCLGRMKSVSREGRTVLFVSHNLAAIRSLCSRALLLQDGRLEAAGPADEVIERYLRDAAAGAASAVELPRPAGADTAVGISLRFTAEDGQPRTEFRLNEPWRIRFDFECLREADHVIAGVGICALEGVPITTLYSRPARLLPGAYSVEFTVDLPLAHCDLQFVAGLTTNQRSVYYQEGLGHVSIIEAATGEQPVSARSGFLLSAARPEIVPIPDDGRRASRAGRGPTP